MMKKAQKTNPAPTEFNDPIRKRITRRVQDAETAKIIIAEYEANDETTYDYDLLADAYAYFMAEPENDTYKIARNRFKWMASTTVDSTDHRYYLRYILARGNDLIASNGVRFQQVGDTRKPGVYMPDRRKIICQDWDLRFPPIEDHIRVPEMRHQIRDAKKRETSKEGFKGPGVEIKIPGKQNTPPIVVDQKEMNQAIAGFKADDWIDIQGIGDSPYQMYALVMASANEEWHAKYVTILGLTGGD